MKAALSQHGPHHKVMHNLPGFRLILTVLLVLAEVECGHREPTQSAPASQPATLVRSTLFTVPISLERGVGGAHEKISTSSPEAQAYYDQGLSFLYSYDWIRAGRSFNQALRFDSNLAMADMGLSHVYSEYADADRARALEDRAKALGDKSTDRERVRIELWGRQLEAIAAQSDGRSTTEYLKALDGALKADGNNIQLLLLRGMASEGHATAIGQRGHEESVRYYERVIQLDRDNVAAHHFLVHSSEMLNNINEAVRQAEIYQRLAPAVPHAQHMFGHDLRRTKRVQDAIAQFEKANDLAEDYYRNEPDTLLYDWNYRHNLSLLGSTYAQAGMLPAAEKTWKKLAGLPTLWPQDDIYKGRFAAFLLQEGRYHEAIAAAAGLTMSPFPVGRALGHALVGSASAKLKDAVRAREELGLAEKEAATLDLARFEYVGFWAEILKGQVELLQGGRANGVARLRSCAVQMQSVPGSDAWSDTMFLLRFMAEVAIEAQEWDLAKFIGHELKVHAPFYSWTHVLLANLAQHDGNAGEAMRESVLANPIEPR